MILQALVDYYEALAAKGKVGKPGWGYAKISYALNIDKQGKLLNVITMLTPPQQKGKKMVEVPQNILLPVPTKRAVNIAAQFLWDNAKYVLGLDNSPKVERTKQCFAATAKLCQDILENAHGEKAEALKAFFANWQPEQAKDNAVLQPYMDDLLGSANLTFKVEGESVETDAEIIQAWDDYRNAQSGAANQGRCLITGKLAPIARLHPSIKGLLGAQSSGAALVAFNAPAYESYEHKQGDNAPVSEYAAFAYTTALNTLLASEDNCLRIGDMTVVFWAEAADKANESVFGHFAKNKNGIFEEKKLKSFFEKIKAGKPFQVKSFLVKPKNKFYILGLSPNAARISVRFFLVNTFGDFMTNYEKYFMEFNIVKPSFDIRTVVPIWQILQETANKNSKDKAASPLLGGAVLRSILTGTKYPEALYQNTLLRAKADQDNPDKNITKISRIKAAIIKACLMRNYKNNEEVTTMVLNEEANDLAYTLGRLFAIIEWLQYEAKKKYQNSKESDKKSITSGLRDTLFNAASTNPVLVFTELMKKQLYYQKQLASFNEAKAQSFEKKIIGLLAKVPFAEHPIPARFNLEEQGKFILGYYHQVQKRYEKKEEK